MSLNGELWGRTPPLEDPMPKPPEGGTTDLVIRQTKIIHELRTELEALKKFTACTRSHPHEAMAQDCELRTEIARLTNELARLRAAPAPAVPQGEPVAAWLKAKIEKHALLAADCPGSSSVVLKSALLRFLDSLPPVAATPATAPAVAQGETVAWMVYGNYTRQPFGMLSSAEAYMRGLLQSDPDGGYHIRPLRYATPAPAQEPVTLTPAEIDRAVLEATGFDGFGCQPMNTHDTRNIGLEVIAALRAKGGK